MPDARVQVEFGLDATIEQHPMQQDTLLPVYAHVFEPMRYQNGWFVAIGPQSV